MKAAYVAQLLAEPGTYRGVALLRVDAQPVLVVGERQFGEDAVDGSIRSRISRTAAASSLSRPVRSLPDSLSRLSRHSASSSCSPLDSRSVSRRSKSRYEASGSVPRFGFGHRSRNVENVSAIAFLDRPIDVRRGLPIGADPLGGPLHRGVELARAAAAGAALSGSPSNSVLQVRPVLLAELDA